MLGLIAMVFVAAACSSGSSSTHSGAPSSTSPAAGASGATIVIKNFTFHPSTLAVKAGATVTVHNEDPTTHTVTAVSPHSGAFNTGDIPAGATVSFTAPTIPGSYPYICMIHQFMTGNLDVS
jgi:plastocyanin